MNKLGDVVDHEVGHIKVWDPFVVRKSVLDFSILALRRCRGIVESSHGRGAIKLGREVGFRDEGGSNVGICKSLPSFGSQDGGVILRAAIIHYKAICADYSGRSRLWRFYVV